MIIAVNQLIVLIIDRLHALCFRKPLRKFVDIIKITVLLYCIYYSSYDIKYIDVISYMSHDRLEVWR